MLVLTRHVYLDHNATTPVARPVRRAMVRALRRTHGNASSLHTDGRGARGLVERARRQVAALLECPPESIFFTSGGTEGNNAVIKGVFQAAGGGHVVTSAIEHESVLGACRQVEALGGRVTYLQAGRDGRVRVADVAAALRPDTILVTLMHANNESGAIQPVAEVAAVARAADVPLHTDAVQTYGKVAARVADLGCEFLTLSAHKIYGPKGVGAIYWRGNTPWTPLVYGGDQEHEMRAGTEGVHQIVGLGAAAELAASLRAGEHARMRELRARFIEGIRRLKPDARVNEAPEPDQLPGTLNVTFPGVEGIRLLAGLDCYCIGVSIGSACTADRIEPSHVLVGMGLPEAEALQTIRISMGRTTRRSHVPYTLKALKFILTGDPAGFAYLDPQHLSDARIASADTFIIDLRTSVERMLAPSVAGAHEWSYIGIERRFKRVPWDKEVILMCGTGIFSFAAGYRLARAGHPRVRVVYGGYAAWRGLKSGLPQAG